MRWASRAMAGFFQMQWRALIATAMCAASSSPVPVRRFQPVVISKPCKTAKGRLDGSGAHIADGYRRGIHQIVKSLWGLEVPAIAAVNGPAIGLGNDVACLCDTRIASDKAIFGATFLKIGLIPGDGGAWLLAAYYRRRARLGIAVYR
jgi:hypothetical protein